MNLVPIGNSKGVRLSKSLIDKYGLSNGFKIIELDDGLKLLAKKKKLRSGWDEIFKKIAEEEKLDDIHTNTIESFWTILKRGMIGQFHKISKKILTTIS